MVSAFVLLVLVVVLALAFDYINGFHDTANAVATVVSTNVLPGRTAVLLAAVFNFVGAFAGVGVAKTIGGDIAEPGSRSPRRVVAAALLGAIVWNLLTWYYGIPSSSSHALIGGLVGAVWCHQVVEREPSRARRWRRLWTSKGVMLTLEGAGAVAAVRAGRRLHPDGAAALDRPAVAADARSTGTFRVLQLGFGRVHGVRPRLQRRPEVDGHHHAGPGGLRGHARASEPAGRLDGARCGSSSLARRRWRWARRRAAGGS